ncbi:MULTISPECIES: Asp23/Gls24 family envelope stress response protein [unclassified Arthrobacter]|uniref:Asp23/Gls24 family envelope stress response protein n=1 Tax=unclassified Arthrobacter TaxID=235627 RepID=UPI001D15AE37|nr:MULTISPECIES: Asp23/Gls24 family envelope stress response protein [unclassified Arthrobacter]MCC3275730.1 Asp23/Gls24 family envelope stress response protein [Arthrobacter sp. zg-Y20]MCC3278845.1 Asp23/Gls24 family envelope stress response protein [Arthrobacter sp. zg-Y40]MCC9177219.1 Asp23/Gls24 family envelope stress response protein [Arthrobacter sp. zg-Y750]MDK1315887.1 Asp23/Gls24 family envelope stress response protein [Arthrobacter sp. zg.Y20]MDK1326082.1 Asp23/Gls24 family envelope 
MDELRNTSPATTPVSPAHAAPATPSADPAGATDAAVVVGRTAISEQAVAKVAAIAARAVPGVFALGNPTGRALGAVRDAVGASSATQGVHVEVGEREVAVDIALVAVYGNALTTVANNVRAAVYGSVEQLVGLRVVEVNVDITDVHLPTDNAEAAAKPVAGAKAV